MCLRCWKTSHSLPLHSSSAAELLSSLLIEGSDYDGTKHIKGWNYIVIIVEKTTHFNSRFSSPSLWVGRGRWQLAALWWCLSINYPLAVYLTRSNPFIILSRQPENVSTSTHNSCRSRLIWGWTEKRESNQREDSVGRTVAVARWWEGTRSLATQHNILWLFHSRNTIITSLREWWLRIWSGYC